MGNKKLNPVKVREIVKMIEAGIPPKEIAALNNIAASAITDIKSGRNWSWVTGIAPKVTPSFSVRKFAQAEAGPSPEERKRITLHRVAFLEHRLKGEETWG